MTDSKVIPFNPLDKRHLGESVGQAMLRRPVRPLQDLEAFDGAGIYAIYYTGDFLGYEAIAACNRNGNYGAPIYVGKAVPKGARKGGDLEASSLNINDFQCRYLIVDDIWIPLVSRHTSIDG